MSRTSSWTLRPHNKYDILHLSHANAAAEHQLVDDGTGAAPVVRPSGALCHCCFPREFRRQPEDK